jgi:uncharacterized protein (DUF1330 family)
MNSKLKTTFAVVAGAALGAVAIQALHAQAKPPAYAVVDISEITDPEGYKAVGGRSNAAAQASSTQLGGKQIARTDKIIALDGTPPKRFVINAFESVEKAQAWYQSAAQKEVNAIRIKTTKSRAFIVEGLPQ